MADEQVVRMYNVLPAIEQTKILIIERLKILFDAINILFQNKFMSKKDEEIIALVKATAISIYLMLKPKIVEYIEQKIKIFPGALQSDMMTKELSNMITRIESSISNPSAMSIEDALYYSDVINIFCHDYGITRITYFSGTMNVPDEKSIYNVKT